MRGNKPTLTTGTRAAGLPHTESAREDAYAHQINGIIVLFLFKQGNTHGTVKEQEGAAVISRSRQHDWQQ